MNEKNTEEQRNFEKNTILFNKLKQYFEKLN